MNQKVRSGGEANPKTEACWSAKLAPMLDLQFSELVEAVWACERVWKLEDRIDAAIRYGRSWSEDL